MKKHVFTILFGLSLAAPVTLLSNVSDAAITLYSPQVNNSGAAVVVFPGGGYKLLAIDLEGTEVGTESRMGSNDR